MADQNELSIVTTRYLNTFTKILTELIQDMTSVTLSDSISRNFIVQMIPHHRAAIEMSKNLLQYTTNIPLQNIALNIVSEQTQSIADMQQVLSSCSDIRNTMQDLQNYHAKTNQIMQIMFQGMASAPYTNDINYDFVREMIPHHRGAIEMSKNALQYPICPGLIPILNAIITSQEKGVAQMEQLLKEWG